MAGEENERTSLQPQLLGGKTCANMQTPTAVWIVGTVAKILRMTLRRTANIAEHSGKKLALAAPQLTMIEG
jgi:hypothetical protein